MNQVADEPIDFIKAKIVDLLRDYGANSIGGLTKSMMSGHIAPYGTQYGVDWSMALDALVHEGVIEAQAYLREGQRRPVLNYSLKA